MEGTKKVTIWDSIKSNPKVLFIAFFASYDFLPEVLEHITNLVPASAVSNMDTSRVSSGKVSS
jgi:hypothetical protein